VRLCLGGKQIGNGGQEMETEVQVPDGGAEDDHRQEVNHHGRIVVVHRLPPKKGQNYVDIVGGRRPKIWITFLSGKKGKIFC
jgi:hypothetical protein